MCEAETVAEVLRLDAEAAPGKWWVRGDDHTQVLSEDGDLAAHALPKQSALIAYYRTAAPVLAREVRRLQGVVYAAYRSGSAAMRERAAAICEAAAGERDHKATGDPYDEGWQDCAGTLMGRIEALDVEP